MLRNSGVCQICKGDVLLVAGLTRAKCASGAPWVKKSGNLSVRDGCDVNVRKALRPYVRPYRLWGRGKEVPSQPDGGRIMHLFLAGNRAVLLGNQRFSRREIE